MSRATRWAVAWTLAVFVGCSIPGVPLPPTPLLAPDKLAHIGMFAVFAVLWLRAQPQRPWTVAVWGAAFGVWIEVWQSLAPVGRLGDPYDAVADVVGLALGLGLARVAGVDRPTAPSRSLRR